MPGEEMPWGDETGWYYGETEPEYELTPEQQAEYERECLEDLQDALRMEQEETEEDDVSENLRLSRMAEAYFQQNGSLDNFDWDAWDEQLGRKKEGPAVQVVEASPDPRQELHDKLQARAQKRLEKAKADGRDLATAPVNYSRPTYATSRTYPATGGETTKYKSVTLRGFGDKDGKNSWGWFRFFADTEVVLERWEGNKKFDETFQRGGTTDTGRGRQMAEAVNGGWRITESEMNRLEREFGGNPEYDRSVKKPAASANPTAPPKGEEAPKEEPAPEPKRLVKLVGYGSLEGCEETVELIRLTVPHVVLRHGSGPTYAIRRYKRTPGLTYGFPAMGNITNGFRIPSEEMQRLERDFDVEHPVG